MRYAVEYMPPRAPLPMRRQSFRERPAPQTEDTGPSIADRLWRLAAFAPAIALTTWLTIAIAHWLAHGGVTALEAAVVVLVAATFIWISLPVGAVTLGLIRHLTTTPRRGARSDESQSVALLVPIYNEATADVFGNALAMVRDLEQGPQTDRFTLFILSDTRDDAIAAQEERAFAMLNERQGGAVRIHYRRRLENIDKKVGNIADWIENWGAGYDAMLVLDADSLMSAAAIRQLARELAADPQAGLIQSFPALIGAVTLFGRMQQFSNAVYGWLLAEGMTLWSQREGNYWGHNAIIRVRAFAESASLPPLKRRGREELILSHDFVEAGLLRRAGWGVRFLPRISGSFEETPQTLIDFALRDRRWCQGNLQHLRLLTTRGFHPVSRFHLLQGACAFLLSPIWFALIVIWSMLGSATETPGSYFNPANPLYPIWPEQAPSGGLLYLLVIYGMLLLPKVLGTLTLGLRPSTRTAYGGWARFLGSALFEIACSILYAPILMVQHTLAVIRAVAGQPQNWTPQQRGAGGYGWGQTLRFHGVETLAGIAMTAGITSGALSLWLLPIAVSLVLAPILSKLSAVRVSNRKLAFTRLDVLHELREPPIVSAARESRAWMSARLGEPALAVAAE